MANRSIYLDEATYASLLKIADRNGFTIVGQVRNWVKKENPIIKGEKT